MHVICSMWAERYAGSLVDKIKVGAHIESTMVMEERRLNFATRVRFLNPGDFCTEAKVHVCLRYQQMF